MADWYSRYPPAVIRPEFKWNVTELDKYILVEWKSDVEITPDMLEKFVNTAPIIRETVGKIVCLKGEGEPYVYGALYYYYAEKIGKGLMPIAFYSEKHGGCVVVKPAQTKLYRFDFGKVLK